MNVQQAATEAFLRPRVDSSKARFTWARPDEELLAEFCHGKMGWTGVSLGMLTNVIFVSLPRGTRREQWSMFCGSAQPQLASQAQKGTVLPEVKCAVSQFPHLNARSQGPTSLGTQHARFLAALRACIRHELWYVAETACQR